MKTYIYRFVLMLFLGLSVSALLRAQEFQVGDVWYRVTDTNSSSVSVCFNALEDYSGYITIPEVVEYDGLNYTVTGVDQDAFAGAPILQGVYLPHTIATLPPSSFSGCRALLEVELPKGLKEIADNTFENCIRLNKINMPNSLVSIGNGSFQGCGQLTDVELSASVNSIGENAFNNCKNLKRLELNSSLIRIGETAFSGCTKLEDVLINCDTIEVASSAFQNCANVKHVKISGVAHLGDEAFVGCSALNYLEICGSAQIGNRTFYECIALEEVILKGIHNSIGGSSFKGCKNLSVVEVDSLSSLEIGENAFQDCVKLSEFNLPVSTFSIGSYAFSGCGALAFKELVFKSPIDIGIEVFANCNALTKVVFLKNDVSTDVVNSVHYGAFSNCSNLRKVEVHAPTYLGSSVFKGCVSLDAISWEHLIIPDGSGSATRSYSVFANTGFEELTLPENIEYIGESIFEGCKKLKEVNFPKSTDFRIGKNAFNGCSKLSRLVLPENLYSLGTNAFANCTSLKSVDIYMKGYDGGGEELGSDLFIGCDSLECVRFMDVYNTFGMQNCKGLKRVYIKEVNNLGGFRGCENLELVDIGEISDYVNPGAFQGCKRLKTLICRFKYLPLYGTSGKAFDTETYETCTLYVPGDGWEFKNAPVWRSFKNIRSLEEYETGIEDIEKSVDEEPSFTDVYDIGGRLVRKHVRAESALDGLPKGYYVVNRGKVMVK